jgi:hypothetical protein
MKKETFESVAIVRLELGGDRETVRDDFIRFMNRVVGKRGRDWAIKPPRTSDRLLVARVRTDDMLALVRLAYPDAIINDPSGK